MNMQHSCPALRRQRGCSNGWKLLHASEVISDIMQARFRFAAACCDWHQKCWEGLRKKEYFFFVND
ncbi:MAG: hypothetical protein ACM34A_19970 [Bacillota bacterium]